MAVHNGTILKLRNHFLIFNVSCVFSLLRYVQPPVINFAAIHEQSTPFSPIVFILSPGSDPGNDLMKLADKTGFGDKFKFLAMGQGQEKVIHEAK